MESRVSDVSAEPVGISTAIDQLPERERDVLTELARAQGGRIGFQALRRRLGLHPQALTRTLRHLETSGFIQRDDLGYGLLRAVPDTDLPAVVEHVPVFAAILPTHLSAARVMEQLQQRWFHGLRWFGISNGPTETVMLWTTETDGRLVRLRVAGSALGVELEGNEQADLSSVAPLMQALAVLYGRPNDPSAPALSGPAQ